MTENKGDIISREALKETIDDITWYHINPYGELVEGAHGDSDALFKAEDIFNAIDNAPIIPQVTVFCENADEKTVEELKEELIRVLSSGDIVTSNGRLVGHINLEDVKGEE